MPSNRKRDVEVFTEAIQLPAQERIAFLDRACASDEDLRRRMEKLLRSNDRAGEFLGTPLAIPSAIFAIGCVGVIRRNGIKNQREPLKQAET